MRTLRAAEQQRREQAIRAAIERTYADADLASPTVLDASRIVPLQQLIAGQALTRTECPGLTRSTAAAFLRGQLPHYVEAEGDDVLSGYLYANRSGGWILVNRSEPVVRRRFTVAHELGHYLLHALPALEAGATAFREIQPGAPGPEAGGELGADGEVRITVADAAVAPGARDWEVEANRFAAALLMPAPLCRALVEQYGPACGERRAVLAQRLAGELLVSVEAVSARLAALGLGRA